MCLELFSEKKLCGSILVTVFAFLVVAYGRFDCAPKRLWPNTYKILPFACPPLACSRPSDSGEDAKVKGTRKVGGVGKRKLKG